MSRARLARIGPAMQEQIGKNTFPGAVTIVARHGQVVHFAVHGFADAAKSVPLKKDALFRLASMAKPIVTAVWKIPPARTAHTKDFRAMLLWKCSSGIQRMLPLPFGYHCALLRDARADALAHEPKTPACT